jgi:hypothetical protein
MITPRVLADSAKTHIALHRTADLGAGADIADIPIMRCPKDITLVEIGILTEGTSTINSAGATFLFEVGSTSLGSMTVTSASTTFAAAGSYTSIGALSNINRLEGDKITYSVTQNGSTNLPVCTLQIEYLTNEVI